MIIALKLVTGESIVGSTRDELKFEEIKSYIFSKDNNKNKLLYVYNPMSIDREDGGMKLRDCLMLSSDELLIFRADDILTCYRPMEKLVDYYIKALRYSDKVTKPMVDEQITEATVELEEALKAHEEASNRLTKMIIRTAGGSGTIQ